MQLFAEKIRSLWSGWEIRVLVLLSLCLQIILIIFGSRRKCTARSLMWISVWSAYLMADWVATVALGNLARNQEDSGDNSPKPNNQLQALWAPFLLLHLGGPDTITAYALEDNEFWLRHLLGLVVQVGVAFYVFLQSWSNISLTFIAIPVFISGIIKYGERTFVLWSSSTQRFKDSLYLTGDVSPDLIQKIISGKAEELFDHGRNVIAAHFLFKRFAYLFAGLLLSYFEAIESWNTVDMSAEEAFTVVEIELGFMYDVLYTKATIVYSRLGIFLRCVSFVNSLSALVIFSIMIDIHDYSLIDISITYVLLVSAIVLEVYASILHFFSDWTKLCLIPLKRKKPKIYNATCSLLDLPFFNNKRWSGSMGQFNLLSYCLKDKPVDKLFRTNKLLGKYLSVTGKDANVDLKETIFNEFNTRHETWGTSTLSISFEISRNTISQRGNYVLEKRYQLGHDFGQFTVEVEFDRSLLIWHLATDLCYFDDFNKRGGANNIDPKCKIAKSLSDYMLYLLVLRPSMMPKEIAELKPVVNPELNFTKTCVTVMRFIQSIRDVISNKTSDACKVLLEMDEEDLSYSEDSEDDNGSNVLVAGCQLAKRLQSLECQDDWNYQQKWKMTSEVWVEMLGYAASHCEWKEHGQQLWKGGELLTHVCLLMAHLDYSQQYRDDAKELPRD